MKREKTKIEDKINRRKIEKKRIWQKRKRKVMRKRRRLGKAQKIKETREEMCMGVQKEGRGRGNRRGQR